MKQDQQRPRVAARVLRSGVTLSGSMSGYVGYDHGLTRTPHCHRAAQGKQRAGPLLHKFGLLNINK